MSSKKSLLSSQNIPHQPSGPGVPIAAKTEAKGFLPHGGWPCSQWASGLTSSGDDSLLHGGQTKYLPPAAPRQEGTAGRFGWKSPGQRSSSPCTPALGSYLPCDAGTHPYLHATPGRGPDSSARENAPGRCRPHQAGDKLPGEVPKQGQPGSCHQPGSAGREPRAGSTRGVGIKPLGSGWHEQQQAE